MSRRLRASSLLVVTASLCGCKFDPGTWIPEHDARPASTTASSGKPTATSKPTAATTSATKPSKGRAASVHLAMGIPTDVDPSDDLLLIKPQYALSYNKKRNDPNWVSANLNGSYFGDAPRFSGKFIADDTLPAGFYRVKHDDYTNSGYDRGHMVRSEERTRDDEDNRSTFLTTNLLPQYHDLNAGPWLRLEEYCQALAQKQNKELYIVAGGVFASNPPTIGKGVAVPDATFKIVVVLDRNQGAEDVTTKTRVIAVKMPNQKGIQANGWGEYRVSVDALERETGYDFLPDLPESVQRVIEAKVDDGPVR